jgi:hypothetical protein
MRRRKLKIKFTRFHLLAVARIARDIVVGLAGATLVLLMNLGDLGEIAIKVLTLLNLLLVSYHLEITIYGKHT